MPKNIYEIELQSIGGETTTLAAYKGKKMLIVNTASECGFTGQYKGLQELSEKYKDNLVVLGFPCNDFGKQEPGSEEEIMGFCEKNYGVTFPMFAKVKVLGDDKHPLYEWLSNKELNGSNDKLPNWNFCKYLVDEKGNLLKFFPSKVKPTDDEITGLLD